MSEKVKDELWQKRHGLAHVLAQAVLEVRPGTTLGFGPPIDDGFYYDFIFSEPIEEKDFKEIEKRMRKIINQKQEFVEENLPQDEALARLDEMGEPYKREYAEELFATRSEMNSLRFFRNGPFLDMCEGPHVASTGDLPADGFKLRSIAGAYWRGNEKNAMMTRIYAWAFNNKEELKAYQKNWEEAQRRDHKKLGKELSLFTINDDIGKGLPLWMPNGTVVRDELEKFVRELEFKDGFQRVATPHLAKTTLYEQTGHLPYYADGMFPFMEVKESADDDAEPVKYVLKPMNCPHHHKIYAAEKRSYRDLPLRFAEYGHCYRYEDTGALSGLLRVRGMCMNDAHIYCTEDQIREEFLKVMEMHRNVYERLGLKDYYMRLSTWDPDDPKGKEKYVDNPAAWEASQDRVREAMIESGLPFEEVKGEAAFYGPKIDFQLKTVTGREETASTNQLDFAVPGRLNLVYTAADNTEQTPYCIHRAPAGTHERFIAFLIEHFGGAFPTWLSPLQVKIIPVGEKFIPYAEQLRDELFAEFVRVEVDSSSETMGKKVRSSIKQKVPHVLVVGDKEQTDGTVTARRYGSEEQQVMPFAEFKAMLLTAIRERELDAARIF